MGGLTSALLLRTGGAVRRLQQPPLLCAKAKADLYRKSLPDDLSQGGDDFVGGASRTRTGDLLGAIQALSQLSYSPVRAALSGCREARIARCNADSGCEHFSGSP